MPVGWAAESVRRLPFTAFLPLLRAGVGAVPERIDLRRQLARTLFHTDRMHELVDLLHSIADDGDADPELLYYFGRAAALTGADRVALHALESSAASGFDGAFGYLAETLQRLGRPDEALAAGLRGLDRAPADFKAFEIVAHALLARGENERLWELCADLRARGVWGAYVPSAMAAAGTTARQHAEVATLVDPARWLYARALTVPGDFNAQLAAELLAHKGLSTAPSTNAMTGEGSRIDQLQLSDGPFARELLARVRAAVDTYSAERQAFPDHPMIAHQPAVVRLNSWAVIMREDGQEGWHIHPSGWASGVYYVEVPRAGPEREPHAGAIEFGPYPFRGDRDEPAWPRQRVMPQAGSLLLFPSYFGHRTWPTGVRRPRISVAFDVVPAAGAERAGR